MPRRRETLRVLAGLGTAGVGGCTSVARPRGTLVVRLRVAPGAFRPFSTCELGVTAVGVDPDDDGWERHPVERTRVDLAGPADGAVPVAEVDLPPGAYSRLRLGVAEVRARRRDGSRAPVVPSGGASMVVPEPFPVRRGGFTLYVPTLTVVHDAASGRYGLQSRVGATWVAVNEDDLPDAAVGAARQA